MPRNKSHSRWTKQDLQRLKQLKQLLEIGITHKMIAQRLGRSLVSVRNKIYKPGKK